MCIILLTHNELMVMNAEHVFLIAVYIRPVYTGLDLKIVKRETKHKVKAWCDCQNFKSFGCLTKGKNSQVG